MPGLFAEFQTDPKLEQEGVLFTYTGGDGKPIFRVKIARQGGRNKNYDKVREEVTSPYRRLKSLSDEMKETIALECFAQGIIVKNSWETYVPGEGETEGKFVAGIETATGIKPATPETIVQVMRALPDLYGTLLMEAMNADNYRFVALEQDAKN